MGGFFIVEDEILGNPRNKCKEIFFGVENEFPLVISPALVYYCYIYITDSE